MTLFGIILVCVTVAIYLYQIIHFLIKARKYFGIENTFDFKKVYFKVFFVAFIVERITLCVCLGVIEDPTYAAISGIICQGIFIIFMAVLRPFISLVSNILVIIGEMLSLGFYVAVLMMDGIRENEWLNTWAMVGITLGISAIGVASLIYNFYFDFCSGNSKKIHNSFNESKEAK